MKPPRHAPQQASLAGFGEPIATDRLMFLIYPDSATATRIAHLTEQLRVQHGLKGRHVAAERLHVTLFHLGDFAGLPARREAASRAAVETLKAAPFSVEFDHVMSFGGGPGRQLLVLRASTGVDALLDFQRQMTQTLRRAGLGEYEPAQFTPHMTLFYGDHRIETQHIEPFRFVVQEFVLVQSLLGRTQHQTLATWKLAT